MRNMHLIPAEEGNRSAQAMNGRDRREVVLQVKAQALLGAAADGDDDMSRTTFSDLPQQSWVFDTLAVHRRHIYIVAGYFDTLPAKPCEIRSCTFNAWHDPERSARFSNVRYHQQLP